MHHLMVHSLCMLEVVHSLEKPCIAFCRDFFLGFGIVDHDKKKCNILRVHTQPLTHEQRISSFSSVHSLCRIQTDNFSLSLSLTHSCSLARPPFLSLSLVLFIFICVKLLFFLPPSPCVSTRSTQTPSFLSPYLPPTFSLSRSSSLSHAYLALLATLCVCVCVAMVCALAFSRSLPSRLRALSLTLSFSLSQSLSPFHTLCCHLLQTLSFVLFLSHSHTHTKLSAPPTPL